MASIREYFDADFDYAAKIALTVPLQDVPIEAKLVCDHSGLMAYLMCYVPGENQSLSIFMQLIDSFNTVRRSLILRETFTFRRLAISRAN